MKTVRCGPLPSEAVAVRRRLARQMRSEGLALRLIAEVFQVSVATVRAYLAVWKQ